MPGAREPRDDRPTASPASLVVLGATARPRTRTGERTSFRSEQPVRSDTNVLAARFPALCGREPAVYDKARALPLARASCRTLRGGGSSARGQAGARGTSSRCTARLPVPNALFFPPRGAGPGDQSASFISARGEINRPERNRRGQRSGSIALPLNISDRPRSDSPLFNARRCRAMGKAQEE